jgi:PUA domain protein
MSEPDRKTARVRRTPIKRKEAKRMTEAAGAFGVQVIMGEFELAEIMQMGEERLLVLDGEPVMLMLRSGEIAPHARAVGTLVRCPTVRVDERAVPHILNGADVMVPGIVAHDEFRKGEAVAVLTEGGRTVGTGVALMSSGEIGGAKRGKAIRVVHTVGDELWKLGEHL